jgi:histidinol-phosphate aminotransferase
MSCDYQSLAVSGVQKLRPYQPGKPIDELARELGLAVEDIVKLASNENPIGPSQKALAAFMNELKDLTRYPDGNGFELKTALAKKMSVDVGQLTLGNGSSDILEFIVRVFVQQGDDVVFSQHAFAIYGLVSQMVGANCIQVPAKDWGHDLAAMADAITDKTKVVFVTNPNNPTGTWSNKTELSDFLARVPEHVVVLLDEAYFEYVDEADYPNGVELLSAHKNIVVTRTFSKAYGLASLRVGYGVSSVEMADLLNRVRPPFNVDSLALAAATATLKDEAYVLESKRVNDEGMRLLEKGFDNLELSFIPSVGNFICFKVPFDSMQVFNELLKKGVIVRPVANYEMPEYLRVSIGTETENKRFLQALTEVLSESSMNAETGVSA